jgi:hypothetical protein
MSYLNKYLKYKKKYLDLKKLQNLQYGGVISFKIFNTEQAKNFCPDIKKKGADTIIFPFTFPFTFPDCGEVTARNLINLICWDENKKKFDIRLLKRFNPNPKLIKYYSIFDNFDKQSDKRYLQSIYGDNLNARNAWSKLIISPKISTNLKFASSCESNGFEYELNTKLSKDNKTTNFFQLIKNLLGIDKCDDIINDNITNIVDNTIKGVGDIIIEHKIYGKIIIHCEDVHYSMELITDKDKQIKI